MKKIIDALKANPQVSDYKINLSAKESYECFYVKGKLETVRCTEVCPGQGLPLLKRTMALPD